MGKVKRLAGVFTLFLLLTGCWDRVEIEERGFVIGVAIDVPKKPQDEAEQPDSEKRQPQFAVTYQFVVPGAMQSGGGGMQQGKGGGGNAFINLTSLGDTMFDIDRQLSMRTSRAPYFEHLKLIVVSDRIAKKSSALAHIVDFYLRDPEMRRGIKILISKGNAKRALEAAPQNEKLPVMYIESVMENTNKTARMMPETRIGDLHEKLLQTRSYAIQTIVGKKKEVKVAGSAVFQGDKNKIVGFLGEDETEGLNFLTGSIKGGIVDVPYRNQMFVYEIIKSNRTITADVRNKSHIRFTINIESEGYVGESYVMLDFLKPDTLRKLEKQVEKRITSMTQKTISKVQKQYNADVLDLGEYLRQEHYGTWKQIKGDWDRDRSLFKSCEITVKVNVNIRRAGIINKSHR